MSVGQKMAQRTLVECDNIRTTRHAQEPSKPPKRRQLVETQATPGTSREGEDETDAKSFDSDLTQDLVQTITSAQE